ncbi:ImmA/IrrE family metallo-endopeptidase [Candidatus Peregrinibacteria bacterium]|nr:ImmA/IrrE family metallo-endopeptidase [Candidatus Peregrinibacteria bacterium]
MTIKVPYIRIEKIRQIADEFREKYSKNKIPVDILYIAEMDLGMEIRPVKSLRNEADTDAFISSDFKVIFVDNDELCDDKYESRLRFSIAHELAHFILHKDFFEKFKIGSLGGYLNFVEGFSDREYSFLELHAHEFAGRLLVPVDILRCKVSEWKNEIKNTAALKFIDNSLFADYLAVPIAKDFGVSQEVIARRIEKEKLL